MDWVVAALVSSFLIGLVTVLDKRIIAVHIPNVSTFNFLVGCVQVLMGTSVALVQPWEGGAPTLATVSALAAGVFTGLTLLLFFYGLKFLEVSRAGPIQNTFPVFVAIMAVVLLDENLLLVHWVAILVVVGSAGLLTMGQATDGRHQGTVKAYALVFVSSFTFAVATFACKVAVDKMNFWNVFFLREWALGGTLILASLRPGILTQLKAQLHERQGMVLTVLAEGVLAFFGVYTMMVALEKGSASLVASLLSTRPAFILVLSGLLSTRVLHFLDEPFKRGTLPLKLLSTAMIVGGVGVLTLV